MRLILFRHGIAENPRDGLADADRALTPRGVERTVAAARGLARVAHTAQAILTSPKTRAAQTAAILGDLFDLVPEPFEPLASEDPAAILRALRGRAENELILVGHEPSMSRLVELLCTGPGLGEPTVELKKAGAALVEAPIRRDDGQGRGTLRWLLPPRILRLLGNAE